MIHFSFIRNTLAAEQVVDMLVQASVAVQHAHVVPNPAIHRDLKPEDILRHRRDPTSLHFDVLLMVRSFLKEFERISPMKDI